MSNLDERLREKLKALVFDEWDYADFLSFGLDSYAEAIIQAFKDEGWISLSSKENLGLMQGRDWYDRFNERMSAQFDVWREDGNGFVEAKYVREAAKKAAGLNE